MEQFPYPCEIIRRTAGTATGFKAGTLGIDDYGNPLQGPTLALGTINTFCDLQQAGRNEAAEQGEVSVTTWSLYLPVTATLDTGDAVRVGGKVYELTGDPWIADTGSAMVNHVEATVVREGQG